MAARQEHVRGSGPVSGRNRPFYPREAVPENRDFQVLRVEGLVLPLPDELSLWCWIHRWQADCGLGNELQWPHEGFDPDTVNTSYLTSPVGSALRCAS
jgi:hypothetical protein